MTCVRTDSFALSELCAFVIDTQGSAKPAPWAKFSHAFGAPSAPSASGAPSAPSAPSAPGDPDEPAAPGTSSAPGASGDPDEPAAPGTSGDHATDSAVAERHALPHLLTPNLL
jgi:hypothetical protein